jgi:hypothetical protein
MTFSEDLTSFPLNISPESLEFVITMAVRQIFKIAAFNKIK